MPSEVNPLWGELLQSMHSLVAGKPRCFKSYMPVLSVHWSCRPTAQMTLQGAQLFRRHLENSLRDQAACLTLARQWMCSLRPAPG